MIHVAPKHRALLAPPLPKLVSLFPEAARVTHAGNELMVIRHDHDSTRLLWNMGYDVKAPILVQYDWAGGKPYEVQKKTAALLSTNRRAYVLNGMGCVDADTEYLSPTGWVRIAEYAGGDVAQYNLDGTIEFVAPMEYVKLPCPEMIRFKTTRGVDQLLSPEHRVLLANGSVLQAEDVECTYGSPASRAYKFRTTFKVVGKPGIALTDDQIRLQVAVNADGYERTDWNKVTLRLLRQRKIDRLTDLLNKAGVQYKVSLCQTTGFSVFRFIAPMPKGFGPDWWNATQHQLEVVADEVTHWDGSFRKAAGRAFSSRLKSDADFVQYAHSAAGSRTTLGEAVRSTGVDYVVYAKSGNSNVGLFGVDGQGNLRTNVWREPSPDGFKYCFMVPSTFLILRRNGCIFATGNTGKTKSALWGWHFLHKTGAAGKLLVVAPLSTLNFTWAREVFNTLPGVRCHVLHGTRAKRLERLADTEASVYVVNHDGLSVIADALAGRPDIDCLVLDELATYRNGASNRTKLTRKVAERFTWVWGMTGSPTPNAPTDAWGQCAVVTPHTVPKYFGRFRDELMQKITQFKWIAKPDALDRVYEVMQPAVRYTLDDVVELPDLVERTIDIDMGPKQLKVYKQMEEFAAVAVANKTITAMNAGAVLNKLLQISCGAVYTRDGETVLLDGDNRLDAMVDTIMDCNEKVIVFAPFKHVLATLMKKLTDEGIDAVEISGDTPKGQRDQIFNLFQNTGKIQVLCAHPKCMAHGVTLTAASTIIWFAPLADLEVFAQANARIRRIGQKHKQQVLMFQSTKVEKQLYAKLRAKEKVQNALLEMFQSEE